MISTGRHRTSYPGGKTTADDVCRSIKNKSPEQFSSVELFRKVTKVLETHAFRLHVRRFILDLFDKTVMTKVVLDDEDEDDDGEPSGKG